MIYFHRRNPLRVALQSTTGRFFLCCFYCGGEGVNPPPPFCLSLPARSLPRPVSTGTRRQPPRPARRPTNRTGNLPARTRSLPRLPASFLHAARPAPHRPPPLRG